VVVLWVPGLLPEHLGLSPDTLKASQVMPFSLALPKTESGEAAQSRLPYMAKLFSNALPTRSPGDNYKFHPALNTFMSCTLPQKEKERRMKDKQKAFRKRLEDSKEARAEGETPKEEEGKLVFDPILFLLTPNQMIENDYPLPSYMPVTVQSFLRGKKEELSRGNKPFLPWQTTEGENLGEGEALKEGWRETERATEPPAQGKCPVLAIDCEMVSGIAFACS
jgi:RNA exonuclease 1